MADTERDVTLSEDEFSTALAEALRSFKYDSLSRADKVLAAGNLFTGRCFGGSAYGFREELNLPNNSKGVGVFEK